MDTRVETVKEREWKRDKLRGRKRERKKYKRLNSFIDDLLMINFIKNIKTWCVLQYVPLDMEHFL